ncbi:MAG: SpoIVB peptidase [Lachnospiraceae bacterium]
MKNKYKQFLFILLASGVISLFGYSIYYIQYCIPNTLNLRIGEINQVNLHMPVTTNISCMGEDVCWSQDGLENEVDVGPNEAFFLQSDEMGETSIELRLFGGIRYKTIDLHFQDDSYVIPSGLPCGIYLQTDGIFVLSIQELTDINGTVASPCQGILQPEDYILKVNDMEVETKEELIEYIQQSGRNPIQLHIRRGNQELDVSVTPMEVKADKYQIGVWVKDDLQGIGTITYVKADGSFGALGHGISESDTKSMIAIKQGALFESKIKCILKGSEGKPGSFSGIICYGSNYYMGSVQSNESCGIFGTLERLDDYYAAIEPVKIGYRQEVKTGKASILCTIENNQPEEFDIEILEVYTGEKENHKNLVIQVTDERLLDLTGGIVQGMSGSPIIQDGKLVGAVTHVLVNDPTRGYGIFIENMLDAAG